MKVKDLPGNEPDASYSYDLLGNMTSAVQGGHTLSFGHDALGRQVSASGPLGSTVSTLNIAGRRTQLVYPGSGLTIDQDHLVTGEVARIRENGANSGVGVLAAFGYDDLGRRTSLTRGNGTVTSYGYDAASRLQTLTQDVGGTGTASDLTLGFGYNPAGQIATVTRSNDGYAFTHFNGTRTEAPNALNQLASVNGAARTHDARGNLTADGSRSYGYSSENMLTSAAGGVTLSYDPLLRLHQVAGAGTVKFGYDGLEMIAEYNASNQLTRRHVHGPGADEPLITYEGSGTTDRRFHHADERGSIVAATDSAGVPLAINRYDEYGVPHGGNVGRFQYTGQAWLPEIGLYHYKARMYDPAAGRFLQADPIAYGGGMNMYAYVGGDPVNFVDPLGLEVCDLPPQKRLGIICGRRSHFGGTFGRGVTGSPPDPEAPAKPGKPIKDPVGGLRCELAVADAAAGTSMAPQATSDTASERNMLRRYFRGGGGVYLRLCFDCTPVTTILGFRAMNPARAPTSPRLPRRAGAQAAPDEAPERP